MLAQGCGPGLDPSLQRPSSTESGRARQAGRRCPPPSELGAVRNQAAGEHFISSDPADDLFILSLQSTNM